MPTTDLLARVRTAWDEPTLHTRLVDGTWYVCTHDPWDCDYGEGPTERAALVDALEAAPEVQHGD